MRGGEGGWSTWERGVGVVIVRLRGDKVGLGKSTEYLVSGVRGGEAEGEGVDSEGRGVEGEGSQGGGVRVGEGGGVEGG